MLPAEKRVASDSEVSNVVDNIKVDIFIRSYHKDLNWLSYCLASIDKFCTGFRVVVVVPKSTWSRAQYLRDSFESIRFEQCDDYRDDYLGQQVTKLHADFFTDADFISHVDSDCIFTRPVSPEDLIGSGKPRILMLPIAKLSRQKPWLGPTEEFLGWKVNYDFMQHPPFSYPRSLYGDLRNYSLEMHGLSLEQYVMARPPRGFSEYNVLGAYAYKWRQDQFNWLDVSLEDPGEHSCRWYWSWGGITPAIFREIKALLSIP